MENASVLSFFFYRWKQIILYFSFSRFISSENLKTFICVPLKNIYFDFYLQFTFAWCLRVFCVHNLWHDKMKSNILIEHLSAISSEVFFHFSFIYWKLIKILHLIELVSDKLQRGISCGNKTLTGYEIGWK